MLTLLRTPTFNEWIARLADLRGRARVLARLKSATYGNFGDCDAVGEGVSEMRIHHGPGYRVYFFRNGSTMYVVLCGGDKSTQGRDIELAKALAREIREQDT